MLLRVPPAPTAPSRRPSKLREDLMKTLVLAARALRRRRAFAAAAILTLAFGIACTTTLFSVVSTVLLAPLPYPHGDRLVAVYEANPGRNQQPSLVAPARLEDWRR